MEVAAGIGILVAIIAVSIAYQEWLRRGVRPRDMRSNLTVDQVKAAFTAKVAGMGWKIIDDDNPMVAQSGLLAGRRQEISMRITPVEGGLAIHVWVSRLWTKGLARVPYKAHTIRMRMNAFERAVGGPISMSAGAPAAPTRAPSVAPGAPYIAPSVQPPAPIAPPSSPLPLPAVGAPSVVPGQPFVAPTAPSAAPIASAPAVASPADGERHDGGRPWWVDEAPAPVASVAPAVPAAQAPVPAFVPTPPPASAQVPAPPPFPSSSPSPVVSAPPSVAPGAPPVVPAPAVPTAVVPTLAVSSSAASAPAPTTSSPTGASPLLSVAVGQPVGLEGVSFVYSHDVPLMVRGTSGTRGSATFHWQWVLVGNAVLLGGGEPQELEALTVIGNLHDRIHVLVLPAPGKGAATPIYQVSGPGVMSVGVGQLSFRTRFRRRSDVGVAVKVSDDLLLKAHTVSSIDSSCEAEDQPLELFAGWLKLLLS